MPEYVGKLGQCPRGRRSWRRQALAARRFRDYLTAPDPSGTDPETDDSAGLA